VLPGGSEASSLLHIARTVVRHAECEITELAFQDAGFDDLSDDE
jgi:cob(I)alamin adenosyltransferase